MKKKLLTITIFCFVLTALLAGCSKKEPMVISEGQSTTAQEQEARTPEKTFTLEELAEYDGVDGRPAYVGVDGLVYDVSLIFSKGEHYKHMAGKELTQEFYSVHVKREIEKYPVVGMVED